MSECADCGKEFKNHFSAKLHFIIHILFGDKHWIVIKDRRGKKR